MKKYFYIIVLSVLPFLGLAQSQYDLSFDVQNNGAEMILDYYIQKTSGADFPLGAANFPLIKSNDTDILWSQIQVNPAYQSPFSAASLPNSYDPLRISTQNFINLTLMTKYGATGQGFNVTSNKTKIASFTIPLSGQCAETDLVWEVNRGAINSFNTTNSVSNIKGEANFVNPSSPTFRLYEIPSTPDLSFIDSLNQCEGQKVTLYIPDTKFDTKWFKDGMEINGAFDSIFYASQSGSYHVELSNCNVMKASDLMNVNILPLPEKSIISESNGKLYSSVIDGIQWYHNGMAIVNATAGELIPTNSGIYTVKTINNCGEILSDPFNYAPLGMDLTENGTYLQVFPNPYIGKTNIEVTLLEDSELRIEVYDLKGNLVSLVKEGKFNSGTHKLDFSAQQLGWSAGTYVLKVRSGDKELIQNLVELK